MHVYWQGRFANPWTFPNTEEDVYAARNNAQLPAFQLHFEININTFPRFNYIRQYLRKNDKYRALLPKNPDDGSVDQICNSYFS
jgi:hypothetical protein